MIAKSIGRFHNPSVSNQLWLPRYLKKKCLKMYDYHYNYLLSTMYPTQCLLYIVGDLS